jgi:hypothetical protein
MNQYEANKWFCVDSYIGKDIQDDSRAGRYHLPELPERRLLNYRQRCRKWRRRYLKPVDKEVIITEEKSEEKPNGTEIVISKGKAENKPGDQAEPESDENAEEKAEDESESEAEDQAEEDQEEAGKTAEESSGPQK